MAQALQSLHLYDKALNALASALRMCPMKPEQELEIVRDAVSYALMTTGKLTPVWFKMFSLLD